MKLKKKAGIGIVSLAGVGVGGCLSYVVGNVATEITGIPIYITWVFLPALVASVIGIVGFIEWCFKD